MKKLLFTSTVLAAQGLAAYLAMAAEPAAPAPAPSPQALEFFEKNIRPVLAEKCYSCHGPKNQFASLRLDSRAGILKGSDKGAVLVPGDPEKSRLIQAIRHANGLKMPPAEKLSDKVAADFTEWVKLGAPWPADAAAPAEKSFEERIGEAKTGHWAFRPVRRPALPAVKDKSWAASPIDRFVLAKLEAKGLRPAPPADRSTLIRRVTYDLTGLPPTPAEVSAFVVDKSPNAYAKVVDRLLASPQYGERWGRLWLDVARYADTLGYLVGDAERRYPFAYTYRDYVVRSLNEDKSYDRFLMEQIAGDQLELKDPRDLAALGFLTVGNRYLFNRHEIIDDRIDVVTRGLQALTVGCARCHDHKYDPIPTADYYALYSVFANSQEPGELPIIGEPADSDAYQKFLAELKEQEAKLAALQAQKADEKQIKPLQDQIAKLKSFHPGAPPRAMVLNDAPKPSAQRIFLRGNPGTPGNEVPRRFLTVLASDQPQPFQKGSGRLELAKAIASAENPLTARVMVNRVWMHHFGQGIVATSSDFGVRGDTPSHPELLDWLASVFASPNPQPPTPSPAEGLGWSLKKLHRLIVLSNSYRMASTETPQGAKLDADNRLFHRMNRRRLDFEQMRDTMLAAGNMLDLTRGGRAVDMFSEKEGNRRTLYGFIDRQNLPGLFRTFDFADPNQHSPKRHNTVVPQQALYMLNNGFMQRISRGLVEREGIAVQKTDEARIRQMYRVLFGRSPSAEEIALGLGFIRKQAALPEEMVVEVPTWHYGFGEYDAGAQRLKGFTPLPHFTGSAWQGGPKLPDPKLGWVTLSNDHGHAGNNLQHSAVRRWVAPQDMVVSIGGQVRHGSNQGDGIRALIVSSRRGLLGRWEVFNTSAQAGVARVEVKRGDTLDFIVECGPTNSFDSFQWAPTLNAVDPAPALTQTAWDAAADFAGPVKAEARKPLTAWEAYAQALLLTNEFLYID